MKVIPETCCSAY